ncbi:MAG: alpha/beta hydrolase [Alistipes sp.]|nr:alpha/beta hydrolase [Alistipes sp.]
MLNYKVIANNPSNSWVVIVPDAGHVCNVDNKNFFNRASIEFFKQFGRL